MARRYASSFSTKLHQSKLSTIFHRYWHSYALRWINCETKFRAGASRRLTPFGIVILKYEISSLSLSLSLSLTLSCTTNIHSSLYSKIGKPGISLGQSKLERLKGERLRRWERGQQARATMCGFAFHPIIDLSSALRALLSFTLPEIASDR